VYIYITPSNILKPAHDSREFSRTKGLHLLGVGDDQHGWGADGQHSILWHGGGRSTVFLRVFFRRILGKIQPVKCINIWDNMDNDMINMAMCDGKGVCGTKRLNFKHHRIGLRDNLNRKPWFLP
jgi:hypothetical protein